MVLHLDTYCTCYLRTPDNVVALYIFMRAKMTPVVMKYLQLFENPHHRFSKQIEEL